MPVRQWDPPNERTSAGTLLGTKKGIQALISFLKKSGAFTRTGEPGRPVP